MSKKPIYEQVSAGKPGKKFVASGLYRLVGFIENKRFVRATAPTSLRTRGQWNAARAPLPTEANGRWRCPMCLTLLPTTFDEIGQYQPCASCGYAPQVAPQHLPSEDTYTTFAAPDTLSRVIALKANPGQVAEYAPVPVRIVQVAAPAPRTTFAPIGNIGERILAYQRDRGLREKATPPLRTMESRPCLRCRKSSCNCPPAPPSVLDAAVQRRAIETQRQHDADLAAFPALRQGQL